MSNSVANPVIVYKGRTNTVYVNLGIDVSGDTITSQIRSEPEVDSPLIAAWTVSFVTDGVDGRLKLTLDDEITSEILYENGYMDLKRVSGGEPLPVFDEVIPVVIKRTVTE